MNMASTPKTFNAFRVHNDSDGYRSGHGVYEWATGDRYEGNWKDNARHGYGIMTWVSLNQQYEGLWENDNPVSEE